MSASTTLILIDLLAISILVFGVYYPRHRRSDLVVAFFGVNIGVLAVSEVLGSSTVGAGLGLGLFGVLSIIRLRSSEISQREVAYYFAALAIGLISGLSAEITVLNLSLIALLVGVLALADSALVSNGVRTMEIQLDVAISDPSALPVEIRTRTGADVVDASIQRIDYVNDTTTVSATVRTHTQRRTPSRIFGRSTTLRTRRAADGSGDAPRHSTPSGPINAPAAEMIGTETRQ